MTGPASIPASPMRRRAAGWVAVLGAVGLCVAAFLPHGEPIHAPVTFLVNPTPYVAFNGWILLVPFPLALILIALRAVAGSVRSRGMIAFVGWAAVGSYLLGLMAMALGLGQGLCGNDGLSWSMGEKVFNVTLLVLLGAATLAVATLAAAPGRVRLVVCGGILGIVGTGLFGYMAWSHARDAFLFSRSSPDSYGLFVSLASCLLMATGGAWETILLWRTGNLSDSALSSIPPEALPSKKVRVACWTATAGMLGLSVAAFMDGWEDRSPIVDFTRCSWGGSDWILFTPFFMAALLLAIRFGPATLRRSSPFAAARVTGDWAAAGGSFIVYTAAGLALWHEIAGDRSFFSQLGTREVMFVVLLAMMAASAIAAACLVAVPARARLAAASALAGVYCLCFMGFTCYLLSTRMSAGLILSLVSSGLFAVGGIRETIFLWRDDEPEGTPR